MKEKIREKEDSSNREEQTEEKKPTNREKVVKFVKEHGLEIVLGLGCVGLGATCVRQGHIIEMKDKIIELQRMRIQDLVSLCEEKDAWFKKLMSEALKLGSSFAGKCMVDRREMLAGR